MKKLHVTIAMLFLCVAVYAQEVPKAIKVDEFGPVTCGDLHARVDSFHIQLSNNPMFTGVVVITPGKESHNKARFFRNYVERYSQRREIDLTRIKFYKTAEHDSVRGSFWLLPAGAELPIPDLEEWPAKPLDISKPFIFGSESDVLICETFAPKIYAELIKSNPNLRGHIVIYPDSRLYQRAIRKEWLKTFTSKYEVPRKSLRFFYAKESDPGHVEFWIVPIKKK